MVQLNFFDKLKTGWNENKFVCVGLDSDFSKIPQDFKEGKTKEEAIFAFNKSIIDQTFDLVCCYKLNSAFYEAEGTEGLQALKKTVDYINEKYPEIATILDAKRGDIGNTNEGYTKNIFDYLGFDAVTVSPYLGKESLEPFLQRTDKGVIILVKTSNPGAGEFQDLMIENQPLYQIVAKNIIKDWNNNKNCAVVVGATYPEELKKVREIIGDMPILIPGIGAQGGDLAATIKAGLDSKNQGIIISSSRGIIFALDPREATLKLTNQIKSIISDLSS